MTTSGNPLLEAEEVLVFLASDCSSTIGGLSGTGQLHLSSQRLIWIPAPFKRAMTCSLESIASAKLVSSGFFSTSQKLEVVAAASGGQTASAAVFAFKNKADMEAMLRRLERQRVAVAEQKIAAAMRSASASEPQLGFSTRSAGVSGILLSVQSQAQKRDESLTEAFTDLKALMENAKPMVEMAQRIARSDSAAEGGFDQYLMSVGLQSPVTKASSGTAFHQQLARQLCDFLERPLAQHGGILPLTDVYCLYNRARGTDLISPDDLVRACSLFAPLALPLRFTKFPSGVLVVHSEEHSDEAISSRLQQLAHENGPLTAFAVAKQLKCAITLAQEQLFTAENSGHLCRDQSVEGLLFYPNLFPTFSC